MSQLDRSDRKMCINQTEMWLLTRQNRAKIFVLIKPNRQKYGYQPDRTVQNMGINQSQQTEIRVLTRPNRQKHGFCQTEQKKNMIVGQTKIWVSTRPKRTKYRY